MIIIQCTNGKSFHFWAQYILVTLRMNKIIVPYQLDMKYIFND